MGFRIVGRPSDECAWVSVGFEKKLYMMGALAEGRLPTAVGLTQSSREASRQRFMFCSISHRIAVIVFDIPSALLNGVDPTAHHTDAVLAHSPIGWGHTFTFNTGAVFHLLDEVAVG